VKEVGFESEGIMVDVSHESTEDVVAEKGQKVDRVFAQKFEIG